MTGRVPVLAALLRVPAMASPADSRSPTYRLVGSAAASTSAVARSAAYALYVVGGSGEAIGIAASANTRVLSGGTSVQLPTDRIHRDGFE